MSILKSLLEQDFLTIEEDGHKEVVVKKEPDYINDNKDYICIRKDYLLMLDNHFDDEIKALKKYKEAFEKIQKIMDEVDE